MGGNAESGAGRISFRSDILASNATRAETPALDQLLAAKLTTAADDQQSIEIQLDPPELGRLVIKLVRSERGLQADFLVWNESARMAVQNELPALQRTLEQAGITLRDFNVSQQGGERGGERPAGQDRTFAEFLPRTTSKRPNAAAVPAGWRRAGSIDVRV